MQPVAEGNVGLAFGLVIGAGLSTTIGSTFVFCSNYANTKMLAAALGMSAGVMLYVSFVEIFATKSLEAFAEVSENHGSKLATLCFFGGICVTYLLDFAVHSIGDWQKRRTTSGGKTDVICVCHTDPVDMLSGERAMWSDAAAATHHTDITVETEPSSPPKANGSDHEFDTDPEKEHLKRMPEGFEHHDKMQLINMGLMTGLAIGLHNFPEGLATFIAALADAKLGVALAVAIAVHNIPEGICVAMPVYYATGSKWKGFWWSFVSGISELVGGLFGYLILYGNAMSDVAYGSLFGIVAGMMVYISLKELLPTALKYDPHDKYVTTCMFVGMAIMALSLILFQI